MGRVVSMAARRRGNREELRRIAREFFSAEGLAAGSSAPQSGQGEIEGSGGKTEQVALSKFLSLVWSYEGFAEAKAFAVVSMSEAGISVRFWVVDPTAKSIKRTKNITVVPDFRGLYVDVENYVLGIRDTLRGNGGHLYFQVLPLSRAPERGRGTEADVAIGRVLYADLDYKSYVESPAFEGCKEGEDHALECYYRDGDKWVHVQRPPLGRVLGETREKLGLEPDIVVDSGTGYHLYFLLCSAVPAKELKSVETIVVERLGADPQSKDLARILRVPSSYNPRVNREVKVIYLKSSPPFCREFEEVKGALASKNAREMPTREVIGEEGRGEEEGESRTPTSPEELRELDATTIAKLVEKLRILYTPGHRNNLCLSISGWFAKSGISPVSAARVIKGLYEAVGDSDPLKSRIETIAYSYKKAGISVTPFADKIEAETGVRIKEPSVAPENIVGIKGIEEIAKEILGEEQGERLVTELMSILGVSSSPGGDIVMMMLNYASNIYALANTRRGVVVRARRVVDEQTQEERLVYMERVAIGAPIDLEVYESPLGGPTKLKVIWKTSTRTNPIIIGPALKDEIVESLIVEGLVTNRALAYDVISAVFEAMILSGKAKRKIEVGASGFFYVNGKFVGESVNLPDGSQLKEALEFLEELATKWYTHMQDKFALTLKWTLVAPFSYIIKQRGKWIPWLFLYGASGTGKTTLAELAINIWNEGPEFIKTGANVDTAARLAYVVSSTTLPIVINEPGNMLRDEMLDMLKDGIEKPIIRGKFVKGRYVEYPALAPLIITSNRQVPQDDALLRRLIVLRFTYSEKVSKEKAAAFETLVKPRAKVLAHLGAFAYSVVKNDPSLLDKPWQELAVEILKRAYEACGMEMPAWWLAEPEEHEDVYEDMREQVRIFLVEKINEAYTRHVGKTEIVLESGKSVATERGYESFDTRLRAVLSGSFIPWMLEHGGEVIITSGFLKEIVDYVGDIGGLKSFAELLGWEYKNVKVKGRVVKAIVTTYMRLLEFLGFEPTHEQADDEPGKKKNESTLEI